MQKKSYFSKTLFVSNFKRFLPLWLIPTILWTLVIVFALAFEEDYGSVPSDAVSVTKDMFYTLATHLVPAIAMVYSIIVCGAVWSFSFSNRSIQFVHSLPISRDCVFATNFVSALAIMAVPYAACYLAITMFFLVTAQSVSVAGLLVSVSITLYDTLFFTGLSTLIAMLCSNAVAYTIISVVVEFSYNLITFISTEYVSFFLNGSSGTGMSDSLVFLSPMSYLYTMVVSNTYRDVNELTGDISYTVSLEGYGYAVIYGVAGIAMAIVAMLLYRKLRSESAGDAFTFEWVKVIMTVVTTYVATLALTEIFSGMLFYSYIGRFARVVPMTITMIVNAAIIYTVMKMIIAKTTRVFNAKLFARIGIIAVIIVACNIAFYQDIFNVTTKVPKKGTYARVTCRLDYANQFDLMAGEDDELIELLEGLLPVIQNQRKDIMRLALDDSAKRLPDDKKYVIPNAKYAESVVFELDYYDENNERIALKNFDLMLNYNNRNVPGTVENKIYEILPNKELIKNGIGLNLGGALYNKRTKLKPDYTIWSNVYLSANDNYVYFSNPDDIILLIDAIAKDVDAGAIELFPPFYTYDDKKPSYAQIEIATKKVNYGNFYYDVELTEDMTNTWQCFGEVYFDGEVTSRPIHGGEYYYDTDDIEYYEN